MFCSTIIPTIGRPCLRRAVETVLSQQLPPDDFEIIVVNDSGKPLPKESWQQSPQVQIIHTNQHNRSVARNTGAAVARGTYLHFLDDDDWMLPGGMQHLRELASASQAAWVYGAFRLVDNNGEKVADIFPAEQGNCFIQMMYWEWLPIQASLIKSETFFAVGGFASLQSLLGGFEDIDLSRQIALHDTMAFLPKVVTCIRVGDVGSTTNYVNMFQQNRQSREKTLEMPGTFTRMRASADDSGDAAAYWHGRIVYVYLASVKWNLKRKSVWTAISRASFALAGLIMPARHTISAEFWRGVTKPHIPRQGIVLEAHKNELYADTKKNLTW